MNRLLKSRISIGFLVLLLMFSVISSSPITPSISNGHQFPFGIQESTTLSADPPSLTWTSRTQNESIAVINGSSAVGDHVILNATFPEELNVTRCDMRMWNGFTVNITRPLVIPTDPGGVFDGIIDPAQFDWVIIKGMEKGLLVNITGNFTSSDVDFMAWDGDMDSSAYTYANNIVDMASEDHPENDVFLWESDNDTIVVGCLNYAGENGNWTLHLQLGVDVLVSSNSTTISMDTFYMSARNQTYNIRVTGYTESNTSYVMRREDVQICNFFAPAVLVISADILAIDEKTFNITWSSTDANADDVNYFSLWLSNNDGFSYQLFARNLTETWYLWNSTGWLEGDYTIRVRAYSVDIAMSDLSDPPAGYWPGDYEDGFSPALHNDWWPSVNPRNIGVRAVSDITFEEGEIGYSIDWGFYNEGFSICFIPGPTRVEYYIYRNDLLIANRNISIDYFSSSEEIVSISLDGLAIGSYNYTLIFENPGSNDGVVRDVVMVVVEPNITRMYSFMSTVIFIFCFLALIALIVVVCKRVD